MKSSASQPPTLLFVNKNTNSYALSRSHGKAATAIFRHVQLATNISSVRSGLNAGKVRQAALEDSVFTKRIAEEGWAYRNSRKEECSRTEDCSEASNALMSGPPGTSTTTSTRSNSISELVPMVPIDRNYSDPFDSFPIELNRKVREILQYYLSSCIMSTCASETLAEGQLLCQHRHFPTTQSTIRDAMSDRTHMSALLFATAGRMSHIPSYRDEYRRLADLLMHHAIRGLRKYLAGLKRGGQTQYHQIVLDILYLCVGEWYRENYAAATTHLRIIPHFIRSC